MPVDADAFRLALSHWATGVAIVTARAGERVHGMTVSAFSAVSLEPPLVLVCADTTSDTHPIIREGGVFAVNVLSRDQAALSNRFASKEDEDRRFDGLVCETGATGAPFIPGALMTVDCTVVDAHEAGDHVIYVGRVEDARVSDGDPLLNYRGVYGRLTAEG